MLGAIIGDIVGSTREWHNVKTEDFELLPPGSRYTDDTVMTLAVAKWLMDDPTHEADSLVRIMQDMGKTFINISISFLPDTLHIIQLLNQFLQHKEKIRENIRRVLPQY